MIMLIESGWLWLSLAGILLILEIVFPIAYFLWLGIAAAVTALLAFLMPSLSWQMHILLFSILAIISLWVSRFYIRRQQMQSQQPYLNEKAHQFIGRSAILVTPIQQGYGRAKVDDTQWQVSGEDMPVNSKVRIVGIEGATLKVEKIAQED